MTQREINFLFKSSRPDKMHCHIYCQYLTLFFSSHKNYDYYGYISYTLNTLGMDVYSAYLMPNDPHK